MLQRCRKIREFVAAARDNIVESDVAHAYAFFFEAPQDDAAMRRDAAWPPSTRVRGLCCHAAVLMPITTGAFFSRLLITPDDAMFECLCLMHVHHATSVMRCCR